MERMEGEKRVGEEGVCMLEDSRVKVIEKRSFVLSAVRGARSMHIPVHGTDMPHAFFLVIPKDLVLKE